MLEKTKLVIGKMCVNPVFREALFAAAKSQSSSVPSTASVDPKALVLHVLEGYEIYPTDGELLQVVQLTGTIQQTNVETQISDCMNQQSGTKPLITELGDARVKEMILRLLGTPQTVERLLALTQCVICKGWARWPERDQRVDRCPEFPCPET
jgi:hypothetical protein